MRNTRNAHARRADHPRSGYLLVAVLVCLLLAGLALVPIATRSLELATAAAARQRSLQLHWGSVSCQRTMLLEAKDLFDAMDTQAADNPRIKRPLNYHQELNVVLGGLPFHLALADEDTKANLNSLYHYAGRPQIEQFVKRQMRSGARLPIRLRPQAEEVDPQDVLAGEEALPIAFSSWGQVFDIAQARSWFPGFLPLQLTTRGVTCWGAGRVNLRRAPDETVTEVCRPVISDGVTRRMLKTMRDDPLRRLDRVLEQLGVDAEDQLLLQGLLTEESSCFSLWITVLSPSVRWQQLSIAERDADGLVRTSTFQF